VSTLAPSEASFWSDFAETARFAALLAWPGDDRAQREAVATWAAATLGVIAEVAQRGVVLAHLEAALDRIAAAAGVTVDVLAAMPGLTALRAEIERGERVLAKARAETEAEVRRHVLDPAGGWLALAAARGIEVIAGDFAKAGIGREGVAGAALAVLVRCAENHAADLPSVSVNRVLWAMEGPGRSMPMRKDAWTRARAPHLWAAVALEGEGVVFMGGPPKEAVAALLETTAGRARVASAAAWLAEWGRAFVPAGGQGAVLAGRKLIEVAAAPIKSPLPLLPAELLARLGGYRAPKLLA